jgi:uncharacterized protein YdeI (YjbR/CyaY-like superfamily)
MYVEPEKLYCNDREQWRTWLETNHEKSTGIWLVMYKKASGKVSISYGEAVEEALCFGWIDSKMMGYNEESYLQMFTPRKPKSNWSESNIIRIKRLIKEGKMTPAGMAKISEELLQ